MFMGQPTVEIDVIYLLFVMPPLQDPNLMYVLREKRIKIRRVTTIHTCMKEFVYNRSQMYIYVSIYLY